MEQLIKELAMLAAIQELSKKIEYSVDDADFIAGFKAWNECTSMSPSGCHLGHYKAMINDPDQKKKPDERKWEIDFIQLMVAMIKIPLKFGFAQQWCKSVTVMIKKDPGNPRIKHLRVIHLFEADYNFCLKLLWGCRLVYQGEDNNCFSQQQYGSQPHHQAIDAVHKKTLSYDLSCIM
jgi:hypothetical protein